MIRAALLFLTAATLIAQEIPVCVHNVLDATDSAVKENIDRIQSIKLVKTVIDYVLTGTIPYYRYRPADPNATHCTHVVFIFSKSPGLAWTVQARIGETFQSTLSRGAWVMNNDCTFNYSKEDIDPKAVAAGQNRPFLPEFWERVVRTRVSACFEDAQSKDTPSRNFRTAAPLARGLHYGCDEAGSAGCVVLPLKFEEPYNVVAEADFEISVTDIRNQTQRVPGRSQGACATFVWKAADGQPAPPPIEKALTVNVDETGDSLTGANWEESSISVKSAKGRRLDQGCPPWKPPLPKRSIISGGSPE